MIKQLSKEAKKIFLSVIENLNGGDHVKINNADYCEKTGGFMPVTVEVLGRGIATPWGTGTEISIAHYYEQNGDLMQDPEMTFLIVDNREGTGNFDLLGIWPLSFQQAGIFARYETCMFTENGKWMVNKKLQNQHATFANMWLRNIKHQQELKISNN